VQRQRRRELRGRRVGGRAARDAREVRRGRHVARAGAAPAAAERAVQHRLPAEQARRLDEGRGDLRQRARVSNAHATHTTRTTSVKHVA
jgi:hypothetical protein